MDKAEKIFFEIHTNLPREGPGNFASTKKAYDAIRSKLNQPLILDIGCGPGKQTLDILEISDGNIIAIDNHKPFVEILNSKIKAEGFDNRASAQLGDMFNLQFKVNEFDLIWSEGAIYQIGFKKGLTEFKKYLKPLGFLAVTEATWLTQQRTKENIEFWRQEYPEMRSVDENIKIIEICGYTLIDYFTIDISAWWDDYYEPMLTRLKMIKEKYGNDETATKVINAHEWEIEVFEKYSNEYGYVFYILQNKN